MAGSTKRRYAPQALEDAIQAYFTQCANTTAAAGKRGQELSRPPTLEGLAAFLHISKSTLRRYFAGGYPGSETEKRRVADCMERACDYMTAETLEGALLGHYDARICTMILNGMGYGAHAQSEQDRTLTVEWKGISAEDIMRWSE